MNPAFLLDLTNLLIALGTIAFWTLMVLVAMAVLTPWLDQR